MSKNFNNLYGLEKIYHKRKERANEKLSCKKRRSPLDIKSPAGLRILAETRLSVAGSVTHILLGTNQSVNTLR